MQESINMIGEIIQLELGMKKHGRPKKRQQADTL